MRDERLIDGFSATTRASRPRTNPQSETRNREAAFTLTEMFTTVAILVIVLGLMVSLARDVRARSAQGLTRDLLARLDAAVALYQARTMALPAVPMLEPMPDEAAMQRYAATTNVQVVRALRGELDLSGVLGELPVFIYDQRTVRDSWGSPVLFLPKHHPAIGLGVGDRPFFVSAGPDRRYLTRDDNLYSYETAGVEMGTTDEQR